MEAKKITEIIDSINSVSLKIKEIPKENFSKLLNQEIKALEEKEKVEEIKMFIQNLPRNIIFEEEEKPEQK